MVKAKPQALLQCKIRSSNYYWQRDQETPLHSCAQCIVLCVLMQRMEKNLLNMNASRTGVGCHPQWRLISCLKGSTKPSSNMVFHDTKHPHTVGIPSPRPCSSNHLTSPLLLSPPIVDDCKPGLSSVILPAIALQIVHRVLMSSLK